MTSTSGADVSGFLSPLTSGVGGRVTGRYGACMPRVERGAACTVLAIPPGGGYVTGQGAAQAQRIQTLTITAVVVNGSGAGGLVAGMTTITAAAALPAATAPLRLEAPILEAPILEAPSRPGAPLAVPRSVPPPPSTALGPGLGAAPSISGVALQPVAPGPTWGPLPDQPAWLRAIDDDGRIVGYVRPAPATPEAGAVSLDVPSQGITTAQFVPAMAATPWVQNHDPNTRIYSGPTPDAVDFGVAAPQFTTFTVVGPQAGGRIFVFNPFTQNYGWIDAVGVGPSGPPV
ncbi:MAG: hypothetical protein HY332_18555 [Chloroflexi bacterium]|nr:hypothetical protein [Chloroflexota bacterium]